jgi:hypothetical protein
MGAGEIPAFAGTVWATLARSEWAIASGIILACLLVFVGRHKDYDGSVASSKIVAAVSLGASSYTFFLVFLSEMIFHGPTTSTIIGQGFGDQRIGWLLVNIVFDSGIRIYNLLYCPLKTAN